MSELINLCVDQFRIGYFGFLVILPILFVISLVSFKINSSFYKLSHLFVGIVYYLLLTKGNVEPLILIGIIAFGNILLMEILRTYKNKLLLYLGVFFNLLPLVFMKEYLPIELPKVETLMSVMGLSYISLNSISMLVDLYKGVFKTFGILDVLVYLLFFPKILAGPLVRFKQFKEELDKGYADKSGYELNYGLFIIGCGILKKWIADYIYQYPSVIFSNVHGYSGSEILLSAFLYTVYIFLDFSGYTDVARGTALLMGIRLPENFRTPYVAINFREFWRRWHITLYEWIRDYIYIGLLGGSRKGWIRTNINVLIAFLFSGMWHGNTFNFIIWGFLHGLGVVLSRNIYPKSLLGKGLSWFITFICIMLLWVVFAINDLNSLYTAFYKMINDVNLETLSLLALNKQELIAVGILGYLIALSDDMLKNLFVRNRYGLLFASVAFYILAVVMLNHRVSVSPFLYEGF